MMSSISFTYILFKRSLSAFRVFKKRYCLWSTGQV